MNLTQPLLLAAALAAAGCTSEPTSKCGPVEGTVSSVVDGDTVVLSTGEKIRYLMVNSTEITSGKNECWGHEAAEYNASLVLDKKVTLTYDQECTDRYGRLLAYISVDGREVNTLLVERGYACVMHIAPNGDARLKEFEDLQSKAKAEKRGVWACNPVPCD